MNTCEALLQPGDSVRGTYIVERFLGAGAFAEVYLVTHRFLGRQALKAYRTGPDGPGPDALLAEARTLVDLTHPNIVRVYDANVDEVRGVPFAFLTMEWCPTGTLADRLHAEVKLPAFAVRHLGLQVCAGLAYAHALEPPLLHLDVKPANLLLFGEARDAQVKLADFGVAARLDPVTRLVRSAGTLSFAAPEVAWGVADERADVYSVGVTLYRALCGIHPFPTIPAVSVSTDRQFHDILVQTRRRVIPPSQLLLGEAPGFDAVLLQALAFDPFERFRNAAELGAALASLTAA